MDKRVPPPEADSTVLDLGSLPSLVGYRLRRAQLAVFADFIREFETLALRPAQFSVLAVLRQNPGARASQVAGALGIQRTNFSALLNGLQARGLVERRTGLADGRAAALHLSEAGAALLVQADAAVRTHEARWRRRIGAAQYRQLLTTLQAIGD